jgi:hypothetical protein
MAVQTTQTLPPPFITTLGENFSAALTGATDEQGQPIGREGHKINLQKTQLHLQVVLVISDLSYNRHKI